MLTDYKPDIDSLQTALKWAYQSLEKNEGNVDLVHGPTDEQLEYRIDAIKRLIEDAKEQVTTAPGLQDIGRLKKYKLPIEFPDKRSYLYNSWFDAIVEPPVALYTDPPRYRYGKNNNRD